MDTSAPLIIFVGQDKGQFQIALRGLQERGYQTIVTAESIVLWTHLIQDQPFAVVIDSTDKSAVPQPWLLCRDLVKSGGWFVVALVRAATRKIRTLGLEHGASQILVIPGFETELFAFLNGQQNKARPEPGTGANRPGPQIEIRWNEHLILRNSFAFALTPLEYALLRYLACQGGRAVPLKEIYDQVFQSQRTAQPRALLKNYVLRVRKKLEPDPNSPRYLKTIRGVGYQLSTGDMTFDSPINGLNP